MNGDILKIKIEEIISLFKNKKINESLRKTEKLLENEKNTPFLYNLHGVISINLKNWKKAKDSLNIAIIKDKTFVEAHNNLGVVNNHLGNFDKAITNFLDAIALKKDYANGYNNLGSIYDDLGNYEKALDNYVDALKFDTKHTDAQTNLIHLLNFYRPKNKINNSIIKVNDNLQKINFKFSLTKDIKIMDISNYFKSCNNTIINNIEDIHFHDSQIYRKNKIDLNCTRHHKVFNKFEVIPEFCFSCYKIQIEPKNVLELFKLFFIFDKLKLPNNNTRKCFTELRPGTTGTYKGLIYCSSTDEANKIFKNVQSILKKIIGPGIKLSIKRGCSEFSAIFPNYKIADKKNTKKMIYNKNWKIKENLIDQSILKESKKRKKVFENSLSGISIADVLIMNNWLNYAKSINDDSYKKISEKIFYSHYISTLTLQQLDERVANNE